MTDREAAEVLIGHWRAGAVLDGLPQRLCPESRAAGYAVQAAGEALMASPVVGWKIAATSAAGQAHINVDGPLAGRIYGERVLQNGAEVPLKGNTMRVAELEFAFRLSRDLPPLEGGYSDEEVGDAVGALHPAVEVPSSRYSDFCAVGAPSLIADQSCGHFFVFGEAFDEADWRGRDLSAWEVRGLVDGQAHEGIGRNVLGDPWLALKWLVDEASRFALPLRAGQFVSTGTCLTPIEVSEGDRLVTEYGCGVPISLSFV